MAAARTTRAGFSLPFRRSSELSHAAITPSRHALPPVTRAGAVCAPTDIWVSSVVVTRQVRLRALSRARTRSYRYTSLQTGPGSANNQRAANRTVQRQRTVHQGTSPNTPRCARMSLDWRLTTALGSLDAGGAFGERGWERDQRAREARRPARATRPAHLHHRGRPPLGRGAASGVVGLRGL